MISECRCGSRYEPLSFQPKLYCVHCRPPGWCLHNVSEYVPCAECREIYPHDENKRLGVRRPIPKKTSLAGEKQRRKR